MIKMTFLSYQDFPFPKKFQPTVSSCFQITSRFQSFSPIWHDVWKQEKCLSLEPPRGNFYKTQWAGQGVKITR